MQTTPPLTAVRLAGLKDWIVKLLVKPGMFAAEAEIAALRMMESELIGRPAGGLRWLPRLVSAIETGDIDPRARLVTLADLPALAVIDGGTGLGQVALTSALQSAVTKAQAVGSATVAVKNSRPVGDPTACLAIAAAAGCVAGILTTCKAQTDPWPIGPCTVWGWPGTDTSLATSSAPPAMHGDLSADVLAAGLGGRKSSVVKKRLFGDDAEFVCSAINLAKCTELAQFQEAIRPAMDSQGLTAPAWIFDSAAWPATAEFPADVLAELRELGAAARVPADW